MFQRFATLYYQLILHRKRKSATSWSCGASRRKRNSLPNLSSFRKKEQLFPAVLNLTEQEKLLSDCLKLYKEKQIRICTSEASQNKRNFLLTIWSFKRNFVLTIRSFKGKRNSSATFWNFIKNKSLSPSLLKT